MTRRERDKLVKEMPCQQAKNDSTHRQPFLSALSSLIIDYETGHQPANEEHKCINVTFLFRNQGAQFSVPQGKIGSQFLYTKNGPIRVMSELMSVIFKLIAASVQYLNWVPLIIKSNHTDSGTYIILGSGLIGCLSFVFHL